MKYEFTGLTNEILGITLKQIKRLNDGVIGGWIEKDINLSQWGSAWVSGDAQVSGDALVSGNAIVGGRAVVSGDALVAGDAVVYGNALVSGDAWVAGRAVVSGDAVVSGNARVTKIGDLIHISNLQYPLTVTIQNCAIGCKIKTHEEWLKITLREAVEMGLYKHNYKFFKQLLPILFKQVRK